MTIPDEAVRAAQEATEGGFGITDDYMRAALTAALPFLQGVKVKELEWEKDDDGIRDRAQTVVGWYFISNPKEGQYNLLFDNEEMTALFAIYDNLETAKSAAQADYEARILSAIDIGNPITAPSPRAQALEEGRRLYGPFGHLTGDRNLSEDTWEVYDEPAATTGNIFSMPLYSLSDPFNEIGLDVDDRASNKNNVDWRDKYNREVLGLNNEGDPIGGDPAYGLKHSVTDLEKEVERLRALSQPVADGWLPIETAPKDGTEFIGWDGKWPFRCSSGKQYVLYPHMEGGPTYRDVWDGHYYDSLTIERPTHWRPLPASPGASE